mmetsp:Transcript_18371/g.28993  ORF Transcript_18371/g.28993 Transcript_18371/m.28993 type:complete len:197 (-) Transcript_18371:51-641(-)
MSFSSSSVFPEGQVFPAASGQYFRGFVRSFFKDKGWGHISSPQAHAVYKKDVFVLASAFPMGVEVTLGDEIDFTLRETPKGPQAVAVAFVHKANPPAPSVNTTPSSGRFFGVISRSFDMAKGWGHIECQESRAIYGRDIFLLRSKLKLAHGDEVAYGNQVEFAVEMGPKGPQAEDVCLVDYGPTLADAIKYRANPF